ncbi:MAG: hypothetical protein H6730_21715 [Deltaproteobacteria bacterium]|nr:hypothetical protein [Deltaproteobacteria bacterium]
MRRPSCERSAWARWLTAACGLIAGCGGCPGSTPPPAVEVAGCAAWRAVGTCVAAADTRLVLWFPGEADELRLEGAVVTATAAVEEGTQVILQSPAPPAVLHLSGAGSEGRWRWPLTRRGAAARSGAVQSRGGGADRRRRCGAEAAGPGPGLSAPPMIRKWR